MPGRIALEVEQRPAGGTDDGAEDWRAGVDLAGGAAIAGGQMAEAGVLDSWVAVPDAKAFQMPGRIALEIKHPIH